MAAEKLRLLTLSYNVAKQSPTPEAINTLLIPLRTQRYDFVYIALQESPLLEYLNVVNEDEWGKQLAAFFLIRYPSYALASKYKLFTNSVYLFVAKPYMMKLQSCAYRQYRYSSVSVTKATIGMRVCLKDAIKKEVGFSIVASHLTHDTARFDDRVQELAQSSSCDFADDPISLFRIWVGDLNFRVDLDVSEALVIANEKKFDELFLSDQLQRAHKRGEVFAKYAEAKVSFPPTYKYIFGSNKFDQRRAPSWCDRIFYDASPDIAECTKYSSIEHATFSDHRPVFAEFVANIDLRGKYEARVLFEALDNWDENSMLLIRFCFCNSAIFQASNANDRIMLFEADTCDYTRANTYTYFSQCSDGSETQSENENKHYIASLSAASPGSYRVGYISETYNCVFGLSKSFTVKPARS